MGLAIPGMSAAGAAPEATKPAACRHAGAPAAATAQASLLRTQPHKQQDLLCYLYLGRQDRMPWSAALRLPNIQRRPSAAQAVTMMAEVSTFAQSKMTSTASCYT